MESLGLKLKKTIRKVAALSVGAAMMGATITGALAAGVTLGDWKDTFQGAKVVVGSIPASEVSVDHPDYNAANLIASEVGGVVEHVTSDQHTISAVGNKLTLGESIADIENKLDDDDLDILADQTFYDDDGTAHDYTQELSFVSGTGVYEYTNDDTQDDEPAGDYIHIDDKQALPILTYELDFDTAFNVTSEAVLEGEKLTILGREYTIIDVTTSGGSISEMTLLSGEATVTLRQDQTQAGLTFIDVNEDEDSCFIEYGGAQYWIDEGQIKTMSDGTIIGVLQARAVHETGASADTCEIAIGAHKLYLKDSSTAEVNDEKIDYTTVAIRSSGGKWDGFNITYAPTEDVYLGVGDALTEDIFGSVSIVFDKLIENNLEEITIDLDNEEVELSAKNSEGDLYSGTICYANESGTLFYGRDSDEPLVIYEGTTITNNTIDSDNLDGILFLFVESATANKTSTPARGVVHVGKIRRVGPLTDNTTDIEILDTGDILEDLEIDPTTHEVDTSDLGSNINITIDRSSSQQTIVFDKLGFQGQDPFWVTENGAVLVFGNESSVTLESPDVNVTLPTNCTISLVEKDLSGEISSGDLLNETAGKITFVWDSTEEEVEFSSVISGITKIKETEGSDIDVGRSSYGTWIRLNDEDDGDLLIKYPEEPVYVEVVIGATAVTGEVIEGAIVLDSEVGTTISENVIVVGGPCANSLAASLLGSTTDWPACQEGFEAGKGILKLVESGDNVALVVAGYSAEDTQAAAEDLVNEDKLATVADQTEAVTPIEVA